jgi:hypothetical protein
MMWLEKARPLTAPSAPVNKRAATSDVLSPKPSLMAGTRASHVEKPKPLIRKTTKRAFLQDWADGVLALFTDD